MKTKNKRLALIQENLNNPDSINDYINMDSRDIKLHYKYYIKPMIKKVARVNQEILNINLGTGSTE
tara:strand:- start:962 stop:1159 length:198 start_codon:yes stop_codon:yes gene_type:complete